MTGDDSRPAAAPSGRWAAAPFLAGTRFLAPAPPDRARPHAPDPACRPLRIPPIQINPTRGRQGGDWGRADAAGGGRASARLRRRRTLGGEPADAASSPATVEPGR